MKYLKIINVLTWILPTLLLMALVALIEDNGMASVIIIVISPLILFLVLLLISIVIYFRKKNYLKVDIYDRIMFLVNTSIFIFILCGLVLLFLSDAGLF